MYNVIYDDYAKARLVNLIVTKYAREYKRDIAHYSENPGKPVDERFVEYIVLEIEQICVSFKNPAFSVEREIRLVFNPYRDEMKARFVRFRTTSNFVIPYCDTKDLYHDPSYRLPITEVLLAPSPHANLVQRGIEQYLKANGYSHLPVTQSTIPFRTL